jgi:nucleoid-associated protein YgaU
MGILDEKPGSTTGKNPDTGMPKKTSDFSDVKGAAAGGSATGSADFSDVSGGASSTAPADTTKGTGKTYIVKSGDSLSKIAKHSYGDANKWHRIYEANRDKIKNPDLIYPGQEFTIPD